MKFKVDDRIKVKKNDIYQYGYIKKILESTKNYIVCFDNDNFEYYINEIDISYDTRLQVENAQLKETIVKLRQIIRDQDITINGLVNKKSIFHLFK